MLESDEDEMESEDMYLKMDNMNRQSPPPVGPPPRPPKSPAFRRKEYQWMGGIEDETLRLEIMHDPAIPQRPPKPDRFKSPQNPLSYANNNNNNSNKRTEILCSEATAIARSSKRSSNQIDSIGIPSRKSSFEVLHESFKPRNLTKGGFSPSGSAYELLISTDIRNLPTTEYDTYMKPQHLSRKHSKVKSAQNIPNPNYEDSIQPIVIWHQNDAKTMSDAILCDANSRLQRRNVSKNSKPGDYTSADDFREYRGTRKSTLTDDNLDYEYLPKPHVTKIFDAGFSTSKDDDDYEFAAYEELPQ